MSLRIDRVIQLRNEFGLKQNALAEALEISPNQVSKYERGQANPSFETLTQMADLFDTTTDYLLGRSNIPHPGAEPDTNADLTIDEIEWLQFFRERSAANRRRLLDILGTLRAMLSDD